MKKLLFLLSVCLLTITMNAQKCAVLEFRGVASVAASEVQGIESIFMTYFHPDGYTMVDRIDLEQQLAEQGFQTSHFTSNYGKVRMGEILNVDKIVVGTVCKLGGFYNVDVRVLDVKTGEYVSEGNTFRGDYRTEVQKLAQKLAKKVPPIPTPKQRDEPYVIYDYLKVFPYDLGYFDDYPQLLIEQINKQKKYGYNTWRIPTNEEVILMRTEDVGLDDGAFYMDDGCVNGTLRLVTDRRKVGAEVPKGYVDLGLASGTLWKDSNEEGGYYSYGFAVARFKDNLPTDEQMRELVNSCGWKWQGNGYRVEGPNGNYIFLPAEGYSLCNEEVVYVGSMGKYWSSHRYCEEAICLSFYKREDSKNKNYKTIQCEYMKECFGASIRLVCR